MDNFLAKLKPDTRTTVGVSVSPNVGLEMMVVDNVQHKIMKYAHRQVAYNTSTREIEDYNEFKVALRDLFSELQINPKESNVVLNMPNVSFGHKFLPTVLDDEGIRTAITAEVEQNYLFKKNTPVVSWVDVKENNTSEKRYILYSAIQEGVVDILTQIFNDLGANLIAIENTYSSLMKTLEYTEVSKDFSMSHSSWNILLVSQNSYAVFSMLGNSIIEYFEEPLAIKSFNNDEVYVAISQAASSVLEKFPADKLLIISESNDVNAEILAIQLKHPGEVMFLDCNQYSKQPIIDVDFNVLPHFVKAITPEVIGAAIYKTRDFSIKLNFISTTDVKVSEAVNIFGFNLTKDQATIYAVIVAVAILGVCFIFSSIIGSYLSSLESKKSSLEQDITSQQTELAKLKKSDNILDIYTASKDIDKKMATKISYFNSLGSDIPAKVWLTFFYADTNGAYGIKGETTSVDDVHLFFRNIQSRVADSDLMLSKLSVDDKGGIIDIEKAVNATYSFELTNSKFGSVTVSDPNNPAQPQNNNSGNANVPTLPDLPR